MKTTILFTLSLALPTLIVWCACAKGHCSTWNKPRTNRFRNPYKRAWNACCEAIFALKAPRSDVKPSHRFRWVLLHSDDFKPFRPAPGIKMRSLLVMDGNGNVLDRLD